MHTQELTFAVLAVLVSCIIRLIYLEVQSPLRNVPSPWSARRTRLWYFWTIAKGKAHHEIIHLHKKHAPDGQFYAPVVRLGPNLYSISTPDKAAYGISSSMPKSSWYKGWKHPDPDTWTLFTDQNQQRHNETRRKFQGMYSLSSLLHYEQFVDDVLDLFYVKLQQIVRAQASVNMHHWLQCYAFDVIGMMTYGERFGFLDDGEDINDCMRSLETSMVYSTLVGVFAWAHPFLYSVLEYVPGSGAAGRSYLMSVVSQRTSEREVKRQSRTTSLPQKDGAPRDFLDVVMDAEETGQKGISKRDIFMMSISNVIAGSDTTAVSLSSILWHLAANPIALKRLRQELGDCISEGNATAQHMPFAEAQKLPYLQACIKEGLRVCSATGLPLWRTVPKGGAKVLDRYFPEGSEIGINIWVAHYDEDVWGKDASQFRPERWLASENDEHILKKQEAHFMPFGLGSRTCIGRHISYLEMAKVVPMVVQNFDLVLDDCCKTELKTENYWFVRPTDFRVKIIEHVTKA